MIVFAYLLTFVAHSVAREQQFAMLESKPRGKIGAILRIKLYAGQWAWLEVSLNLIVGPN